MITASPNTSAPPVVLASASVTRAVAHQAPSPFHLQVAAIFRTLRELADPFPFRKGRFRRREKRRRSRADRVAEYGEDVLILAYSRSHTAKSRNAKINRGRGKRNKARSQAA